MANCEFAARKDIGELFDLQRRAFESEAEMIGSRDIPALKETFEHSCEDFDNWTVLVRRDDSGRIVGAVRFREVGGHIDIGRLMTARDCRNQGIASGLMRAVEEVTKADTFELFTSSRSYSNIRLYEELGYRTYMQRQGPEDFAFVYMRKTVS